MRRLALTKPHLPIFAIALIFCALVLSPFTAHAADMTQAERDTIAACTQLSIDYSYYRDHDDVQSYAALFSEDGTLQLAGPALKGRQAIAQATQGRMNGMTSRHVITNIRITLLDSERAEGVSYITLYTGKAAAETGRPVIMDGPAFVGDYVDSYVKTKEGWRIASRRLIPAFVSQAAMAAEAAKSENQ